jgi:hypothetical protein
LFLNTTVEPTGTVAVAGENPLSVYVITVWFGVGLEVSVAAVELLAVGEVVALGVGVDVVVAVGVRIVYVAIRASAIIAIKIVTRVFRPIYTYYGLVEVTIPNSYRIGRVSMLSAQSPSCSMIDLREAPLGVRAYST